MAAPGANSKAHKVVVVGNAGVGKTSLVRTYIDRDFSVDHKSTLPADFVCAVEPLNAAAPAGPVAPGQAAPSEAVAMQIWDTAGQERYRSLAPTFFKGAAAVVLVYDVVDASSLRAAHRWVADALDACAAQSYPPLVFVVGNKLDLLEATEGAAPAVEANPAASTSVPRVEGTPRGETDVRDTSAPAPANDSARGTKRGASARTATVTAAASTRSARSTAASSPRGLDVAVVPEAREWAASNGYVDGGTVCAKSGAGVDAFFRCVAKELRAAALRREPAPAESAPPSVSLALPTKTDEEAQAPRRCRC